MRKRFSYLFFILITFMFFSYADMLFAACNVSTTSVNFGNYDVFSPNPLDATGSITVDCDEVPPASVTIAIGPSPNSGGFNPRMMKLSTGSDMLEYNFFTENTRTDIWGDGSGSTTTLSNRVRKRRPWINTVYGRILPGQDIAVGTYTETLTVS